GLFPVRKLRIDAVADAMDDVALRRALLVQLLAVEEGERLEAAPELPLAVPPADAGLRGDLDDGGHLADAVEPRDLGIVVRAFAVDLRIGLVELVPDDLVVEVRQSPDVGDVLVAKDRRREELLGHGAREAPDLSDGRQIEGVGGALLSRVVVR